MQLYPRFIGIYGPDGVGKSTHVDIIARHISSKEYRVKKVWVRGPHTLAFILSWIFVKIGLSREIMNPYGRVKKIPMIGMHPFITQVWSIIEFLSVLPIVIFKIMLPIKAGYIIVADRYTMDTIALIAYHINDITFIKGRISGLLLSLLPRSNLLFHLDARYDALIKRRGKLVEPQEFIEFQKECYDLMSQIIPSHYLDTSDKSIRISSTIILKKIRARAQSK